MSQANEKAGASPMPVTGSHCGIRPSKEAMEIDFEIDFSQAKELLDSTKPSKTPDQPQSIQHQYQKPKP